MNPILFQSYQLGVVVGVMVLSTLILFPGRKNDDGCDDIATNTEVHTTHNTTSIPTTAKSTAISMNNIKGNHPNGIPGTKNQNDMMNDDDIGVPNILSPHRQMNWTVYLMIYIVIAMILFYSYSTRTSESYDTIPLYRRQLQGPTKLLQLTFEAYFPKEASVLFAKQIPKTK